MCFRPPEAKKVENKCPKCGTLNPLTAEVCTNCSQPLPKVVAVPPAGVSMKEQGMAPVPPPGVPPKAPAAPPKAPPGAPPVPPKKPEGQ
jgi:uncharacterized OB-fold protein